MSFLYFFSLSVPSFPQTTNIIQLPTPHTYIAPTRTRKTEIVYPLPRPLHPHRSPNHPTPPPLLPDLLRQRDAGRDRRAREGRAEDVEGHVEDCGERAPGGFLGE